MKTHVESLDPDRCVVVLSVLQRLDVASLHRRDLSPLPPLEHPRVDLTVQLQKTPTRDHDSLVLAHPVLDQVLEEILLHAPGLTATDLPDRVETGGDDLGGDSRVDELARELLDDGGELVGRSEVVDGLGEADEDGGDLELVVGEVLDDVRVEAQNGELVGSTDSTEERHDEDLVVEGVRSVVLDEGLVKLLAERLRVVEELEGGEVDRGLLRLDLALAALDVGVLDLPLSLSLRTLLLLVDLESMLDRLDVGSLVVLLRRVVLVVLACLGGDEEEVDRRALYLRVGVEACRCDDRYRLGVPPDVLPPQLGSNLDRPHRLARSNNLDVSSSRGLDSRPESLSLGVDSSLNHGEQKPLDHAVQLVVLDLDVGVLDVAQNRLENERTEVGRGSHREEGEQGLEEAERELHVSN